MIRVTLPIYHTIVKKRTGKESTHLVGQNWYRNLHFYSKNNLKKRYDEIVSNQLSKLDYNTIPKEYRIETLLFYKNPSSDLDNISSLLCKFANDTFQSAGVVNNDNVKHCVEIIHKVGGKDKENPRCEITVIDV